MYKKHLKVVVISTILIILLGIFYFNFTISVSPDSSGYYTLMQIIDGQLPFKNWAIVRGFSFPFLLFLIVHVFGSSPKGMLIAFFLFHLILTGGGALLLNKYLKEYRENENNFFYWLLYILLIMFNPLILGYSHTLLTEAVAPAFIMLALIVAYKWKDVFWHLSKKKVILYTLVYTLLLIFIWFLKQHNAPVIFCLIFISSILISLKHKSWKIFLEKMISCGIIGLSLIIAIFTWNKILINNDVYMQQNHTNDSLLADGFINGLAYHFKEDLNFKDTCDLNIIKNSNLKEKDKEKIINLSKNNKNWCQSVRLFTIIKSGEVIDQVALVSEKEKISTLDSLKFWSINLIKHPVLALHGYYMNYMTILDFYPYEILSNGVFVAKSGFDINTEHENTTVAFATYIPRQICWWQFNGKLEDLQHPTTIAMKNFEGVQEVNPVVAKTINKIKPIYLMIYRISLLFLLPMAIYCFIKFLKDKNNSIYFLTTTIFSSSLIQLLFFTFMGAVIDRYIYVVLPICIFGYIILLLSFKKRSLKETIPERVVKNINKNNKYLFVIPAYNEEKHIGNVIEDIRKNMPEADIVVINDYSLDNTKVIVEKLNVPCLNVPFNMGYAMAVQAGIKYAYKNDYDYVIQFDADGQHLASEAKKLVKRREETNANIVIGSRFIEKTDYKHPFFRKIGTKLFQIIIKVFCHKNITDPTSGFQLLDKSVIEKYAKIGNYPEFPDANLVMEMLLNGYKIEEVSVKMKENDEGKSMHGGIIKPIKYMINVMYNIVFILIKERK